MDPKTFLQTLTHIIRQNYPQDPSQGLLVARLGYLLKSRYGVDWTAFGYPKLSAALADLAEVGVIRVGTNQKGVLAVWVTENAITSRDPLCGNEIKQELELNSLDRPQAPFKRLRPAIWHAFVTPLNDGVSRRLVHRQTGYVWSDKEEPAGDPQQWVEVDVISEVEQKHWALELLKELQLSDDPKLQATLEQPDWYYRFANALTQHDPLLASRWNRSRSMRVQSHAEGWCERNSMPRTIVFDDACTFQSNGRTRPWTPQRSAPASNTITQVFDHEGLRQKLLEAIDRLTTDELLALPIPPCHLVSVLRPDLNRG